MPGSSPDPDFRWVPSTQYLLTEDFNAYIMCLCPKKSDCRMRTIVISRNENECQK